MLKLHGKMLMQTNDKVFGSCYWCKIELKARILHLTSTVAQSVEVLYKIRQYLSKNPQKYYTMLSLSQNYHMQ